MFLLFRFFAPKGRTLQAGGDRIESGETPHRCFCPPILSAANPFKFQGISEMRRFGTDGLNPVDLAIPISRWICRKQKAFLLDGRNRPQRGCDTEDGMKSVCP